MPGLFPLHSSRLVIRELPRVPTHVKQVPHTLSPKAQTLGEASVLPQKTASPPAPRGARCVDMAPACSLLVYEDSAERRSRWDRARKRQAEEQVVLMPGDGASESSGD